MNPTRFVKRHVREAARWTALLTAHGHERPYCEAEWLRAERWSRSAPKRKGTGTIAKGRG